MLNEDDVKRIRKFLDKLEELAKRGEDPLLLRYQNGLLFTSGCEGDFGCCAEHFDLMGHVEDLEEFIA
jgi:hypothetical protein